MAKTGKIEVDIVARSVQVEVDPNEVISIVLSIKGDHGEMSHEIEIPRGSRDLLEWWVVTAMHDAQRTIPKMHEYGGGNEGSADLQLMGENLATLLDMHDAPDSVKQEMACWFYLQGKIARLVSDYKAHRPGKADTWFDAMIYALMARRIQEHGTWP